MTPNPQILFDQVPRKPGNNRDGHAVTGEWADLEVVAGRADAIVPDNRAEKGEGVTVRLSMCFGWRTEDIHPDNGTMGERLLAALEVAKGAAP